MTHDIVIRGGEIVDGLGAEPYRAAHLHDACLAFAAEQFHGAGEVRQPRMYQLIRQKGPIKDTTLEFEFLDPGVEAFSFTFG